MRLPTQHRDASANYRGVTGYYLGRPGVIDGAGQRSARPIGTRAELLLRSSAYMQE